ncbi:MAG: SUMF1/EgtB/PvdO family nonheme iron enzyme, partial [Hyphomicrobiales bacterium]
MVRKPTNSSALAFACALLVQASSGFAEEPGSFLPELVEIVAGDYQHRLSGEFLKDGYPVDAPKVGINFARPLHIMKYQVSNGDYARCFEDEVCGLPFKRKTVVADDKPVTGVSFIDARNYAAWLTQKTGITWRLPSDAEWAYAAGSRFYDDALGGEDAASDPSERGLLKYQQTVDLGLESDPVVKPRGAYGANEHGVFDQTGNVWEWTDTCYTRSKIS